MQGAEEAEGAGKSSISALSPSSAREWSDNAAAPRVWWRKERQAS
jgi:hypothetical protein